MKIVIDARESGTTTGRYIDKLIEYLMLIDKNNDYVLLLKNHRLDMYRGSASNFQVVECNIKEFTFSEQFRLARVIRKIKPDLVHFPMVQQPLIYKGKVVTTMQDLTTLRFKNPTKNPIKFWIMQRAYLLVNFIVPRKSKHIISISEYVKNDVMKSMRYMRPEKFTVTLESADTITKEAEAIAELEDKKFITYVGRHQPHKNLERLIKAHQALLSDYPSLILAIAGKKDQLTSSLEQSFKAKGYKNVVFTGFVSEGQLRWLYENTSCYVFPSLSEGFGLPGLEAMKHGAPVASSNATCLPEIYGDSAKYFSPYSVLEMREAISDILGNKKLKAELVTKGKKQAAKYSWRRMAEQTLRVYQSVGK